MRIVDVGVLGNELFFYIEIELYSSYVIKNFRKLGVSRYYLMGDGLDDLLGDTYVLYVFDPPTVNLLYIKHIRLIKDFFCSTVPLSYYINEIGLINGAARLNYVELRYDVFERPSWMGKIRL